ncbi:hypothetical protein HJG43_08770 [Kineosporiaceae bacterium SCSIO 59966]|nr:hypothetical protein HJG43_08770 [Kineosporiaceae bacterium SCSIO 59966]
MSATPPHGSLAEEAARLVSALQDAASAWSASAGEGAGERAGERAGPDGQHEHTATPAACRVCPLCQAIAVVQSLRPQTLQHLSDAAASLAAAVADVVAATRAATTDPAGRAATTDPAGPADATDPAGRTGPAATPSGTAGQPPPRDARLQHIDITVRDD